MQGQRRWPSVAITRTSDKARGDGGDVRASPSSGGAGVAKTAVHVTGVIGLQIWAIDDPWWCPGRDGGGGTALCGRWGGREEAVVVVGLEFAACDEAVVDAVVEAAWRCFGHGGLNTLVNCFSYEGEVQDCLGVIEDEYSHLGC
ncbi:hypothetical protein ACQJBY_015660 [Aegilops geniculata]